MLSNAKNIVIGSLILLIVFIFKFYDYRIEEYKTTIDDMSNKFNKELRTSSEKLGVCKAGSSKLKGSIIQLNNSIKQLEIDSKKQNEAWDNRVKPEEYLRQWKIKNNITNGGGNDCENNNAILNSISEFGL